MLHKGLWMMLAVLAMATQANCCNIITDVMQYGAVGDGETDDSRAFLEAWETYCSCEISSGILQIPEEKTFLLKPVRFEGPCTSSPVNIQVLGNIIATTDIKAYDDDNGDDIKDWVVFSNVNDLMITGNGKIDGRGAIWWQKAGESDSRRPTALTFLGCNNLKLSGLTHANSQQVHIHVTGCNNVAISNLQITAPESSPNTDGINIVASSHVQIYDSTIGTGDDCVAIGGGSSNINVTGVVCGPGHGISIGSLGKNGNRDTVEEVYVQDCILKGTTNGLRIKTWQGGSGYARQIYFEGITLDAVDNPIIIDQFYCDRKSVCKNQTSAVKVSNVFYDGVNGTSTTDEAIQFRCSQTRSCSNIVLNNINIISTNQGNQTHAFCYNAYGISSYSTPIVNCLPSAMSYQDCLPRDGCQSQTSQRLELFDCQHVLLIFVFVLLCFSFLQP